MGYGAFNRWFGFESGTNQKNLIYAQWELPIRRACMIKP